MLTTHRQISFHINDVPSARWYGVTVKHGVLAYEQEEYLALKRGEVWVVDRSGFRVGGGGTLENGARFYIRHTDEQPEGR